jgi:Phospholipase_D-nuclease N-terminal
MLLGATFLDFLWSLIIFFFMVAFFMVLFHVIVDIFRRDDASGGKKALWILFVIFVPVLGVLVYLIANSQGMAARNVREVQQSQEQFDSYVKSVAGGADPAAQDREGERAARSGRDQPRGVRCAESEGTRLRLGGGAPPVRRAAEYLCLDRRRTAADLAGRGRSRCGDNTISTGRIAQKALDLEGAARRPGRPDSTEDDVSVSTQYDPPAPPDDVLVDFELRLDPAVVQLQLELPVARAGAIASLDDGLVVVGRRRWHTRQ